MFNNGDAYVNRHLGINTILPSSPLTVFTSGSMLGQIRMGFDDASSWLIGRETDVDGRFTITRGIDTAEKFSIAQSGAATFASSVTATNYITSSDETLKDIISTDDDVIRYKWKNKQDDLIHVGYSAQQKRIEYPNAVHEDKEGLLTVSYVEILVDKIRKLEKKIEQLENK